MQRQASPIHKQGGKKKIWEANKEQIAVLGRENTIMLQYDGGGSFAPFGPSTKAETGQRHFPITHED